MKNWIFKDESSSAPDPKAARTRAMLLSLPFAIVGILALVFLLHDEVLSGFGMKKQMAMGLLSAAIVCGGIIALIFGISAKKEAQKISAAEIDDAGKPWLKRKDWAAGRIASGTRKSVLLIWIFTLFWNAFSAPVVLIGLPAELHKGNHAILIALLFPIVGIGMIIFALNATLAWRKFGQSLFEMAAIPGALGGTLEGEIQVKTKLRPQHGLHLRLSCIRQRTAGSGKDRSTTEIILWQDEKWLRPDLPQTDLNATGIPIYFKLPADQPESTVAAGDGIHWKLEASATLRGPDFHAAFDVPVFKLPEPPEISGDPTAQYQMSLDEMRQQIHSKIQVNDLPDGGKEFIFPAARNIGPAAGLTLFWLVWTGIVVALFWNWKQVPVIFPLVFGAADLLITIFTFNLWFLRSRVVVTSEQVTVQKSWLGIKRERRLAASNVTGFDAQAGMTTGHSVYYDLKIRTGDDFAAQKAKFIQTGQRPPLKLSGGDVTAASSIADKPEADWLVQQMTAAGKTFAATDSNA
jgi:hypothetical protein